MKNQTEPVQSLRKIYEVSVASGYYNDIEIALGYDEFYDYSDSIGIIESEVEPFGFLSAKSFSSTLTKLPDGSLPLISVEVVLDDT